MDIAEKTLRLKQDFDNVFEAGKKTVRDAMREYMQDRGLITLSTSVGEIVALKNIPPLEDELNVKVRRKNLIPYPFYQGTQTISGVTFTVNNDGTITINGTADAQAVFYIYHQSKSGTLDIETADTMLSGVESGGYYKGFYTQCSVDRGGATVYVSDNGSGVAFEYGDKIKSIYVTVRSGFTFNNVVVKPQIEVGGAITGYTPYVEDIDAAKVLAQGANLIPYPYNTGSTTINGITFTDNGDGTITLNGTATARADFQLSQNKLLLKAGVKYTLSGCPSGGTTNTYNLRFSGDPTGVWVDYGEGKTFTPSVDTKDYNFLIRIEAGTTVNNLVFKPQLEAGEKTKYEIHKEPAVYLQTDIIKPIYPHTTLSTDTVGTVVEVECYSGVEVVPASSVYGVMTLEHDEMDNMAFDGGNNNHEIA